MNDDHFPQTKRQRLGLAGKTALKVGAKELSHHLKNGFRSKDEKAKAKEDKDAAIAADIFRALGQMKGLAIKFAQFLSLENHEFLPPAFQRELEKSNYKVPPINKALIRKIIHTELGDYPENVFQSFDLEPLAAASIGQVHCGVLKTGEKVVIKVQYPGIDTAIKSDLRLLRLLMTNTPILKNVYQKTIIQNVIQELETVLPQEIDYEQEFQNAQFFAERIDTSRYCIPVYYPEYCTPHVLCMEFIEGSHIPEWLDTQPAQQERNRIAQAIFDFKWTSIIDYLCIHADPNPGNMIIMPDGRLGLIDFGCVRSIDPLFAEYGPKILAAYTSNNWQLAWDHYATLGMCAPNTDYPKMLESFGEWIGRPYSDSTFDFGAHPDYTNEVQDQFKTLNCFTDLHPNYVFFNRLHIGFYRLAHLLEAQISTPLPLRGLL